MVYSLYVNVRQLRFDEHSKQLYQIEG